MNRRQLSSQLHFSLWSSSFEYFYTYGNTFWNIPWRSLNNLNSVQLGKQEIELELLLTFIKIAYITGNNPFISRNEAIYALPYTLVLSELLLVTLWFLTYHIDKVACHFTFSLSVVCSALYGHHLFAQWLRAKMLVSIWQRRGDWLFRAVGSRDLFFLFSWDR